MTVRQLSDRREMAQCFPLSDTAAIKTPHQSMGCQSPRPGEYLREFAVYAIIGVTLAIHSWRGR